MRREEERSEKLKIGWMYAPDLLEKWLSEMAAEGNHLVRVKVLEQDLFVKVKRKRFRTYMTFN